MTLWDELTPEERCIMINTLEEGYLNCVIGDFLGHAEADGAVWISSTDADAIRALIPRFAATVASMIERDLIEIREPDDGVWDNAPPMTDAEIRATLADPDTWLWTEGEAARTVMLMTTDHADRLLGRAIDA
ncbi:hypothetical protein AB0H43_29015 [Hamadaea sp. NPDC050747]|uniref:hypothetical protein n=1 Tax=Hamadaea sp. NPDC050747 TaxID=3155789 RepID=UPI0033C52885